MTKLSKTVLDKIKKDKIKPIPRWQFVLMHIVLWAAFVTAIILGALAFSVVIRIIGGMEWELVRRVGRGSIGGFLMILPYIWLAVLGIVFFTSGKLLEKTKKGYRYKPYIIVLISIGISIVLGLALYFAGVGHRVQDSLKENVKSYAEWMDRRDRFLVAPDEGVLVGRVIEIKPEEKLMIIDFMGTEWSVDISNAVTKDNFQPQIGRPVGLVGEKISDDEFKADKILPFRPPRNPNGRFRMPIKSIL